MNPKKLLKKYARTKEDFNRIYRHSQIVAKIALSAAKKFEKKHKIKLDLELIKKGSLLHDIGVLVLNDCPYIQHGVLGADILRKEGLDEKYARICENHIGVGITKEEVKTKHLPLPARDFVPQSWEEKIISYADAWHSKSMLDKNGVHKEKLAEILKEFKQYGAEKVKQFKKWHKVFG